MPAYAVFDFEFETTDVPPRNVNKLVFIYWCPGTAPVKYKMVYSTSL